jgi:predicted DNA-binding transcriptional regulator YafY
MFTYIYFEWGIQITFLKRKLSNILRFYLFFLFVRLKKYWNHILNILTKEQMSKREINPLRIGIEAYAFAREYIYKQPAGTQTRAGEIYLLLDELHSARLGNEHETRALKNLTQTSLEEKLRKRYQSNLNLVMKKYNFDFNFQDKTLDARYEENLDRIHAICKDYLSEFCYYFSDETLRIAIKNWKTPGDLLYFLIVLRYAIEFDFRIKFSYRKVMFPFPENRSILPKIITLKDNNLGIIGLDSKDMQTKSFLLSRISNLQTNFIKAFRERPEDDMRSAPFNYSEYLANNPFAKYHKEVIDYEISISLNNLDLLKHSKLNEHPITILQQDETEAKIVIKTHDEWSVFDMLFNYETYAKLTGPPTVVERFKEKLDRMSKHYKSQSLLAKKPISKKKKV